MKIFKIANMNDRDWPTDPENESFKPDNTTIFEPPAMDKNKKEMIMANLEEYLKSHNAEYSLSPWTLNCDENFCTCESYLANKTTGKSSLYALQFTIDNDGNLVGKPEVLAKII